MQKKSCQSLGQSSGTKYQLCLLPVCILAELSLDVFDCLVQRTFFTLKIPLSLINKWQISCSKSLRESWRIYQCGGIQGLSFLLGGNPATSYVWRIATEGFISTKGTFPARLRWQQQTGFPLSIHTSSTNARNSQEVLVSSILDFGLFIIFGGGTDLIFSSQTLIVRNPGGLDVIYCHFSQEIESQHNQGLRLK